MAAVLRALVLVAVAVAVWRLVATDRASIWTTIVQVGLGRLVLSGLMALIATWASWRCWYSVAAALQADLESQVARRLFFVSQLGKYVPGAVWPMLLQAQAARAHGWRRAGLGAAYLLTLAISVLTGAVVAALTLGMANPQVLSRYWWVLIAIPLMLVLLSPSLLPALISRVLGASGRPPLAEKLTWGASRRASLWALLMWVALGAHIAILALPISSWSQEVVLQSIGGMALAFVAGLVAVVAPAGVGVRDLILGVTVGAVTTPVIGLAVALVSRVALLLCDVGLAAAVAFRLPRPSAPES